MLSDGSDAFASAASESDRPAASALAQLTTAERYALLVENSGDVVFQSVEGVLEWVSPSVTALLGWSPEQLIGRTSEHLWHAEDAEVPGELTERARGGEPGRGTYRLRHRDGHFVWVEILTRPYLDARGGLGATGSMHDVSAQIEAEDALAVSEARHREVLSTLPEHHVVLTAVRDPHGVVVDFVFSWANAAACEFEGLSPGELMGASFLALHPTAQSQLYFEKLVAVVETGEPLVLDDEDYNLESLGGERRWFDVRATQVGDSISQVLRDVTDRHDAVVALRESEKHYRLLAENASDVVYRCTLSLRLDWISDSVRGLVGWAPDELVGVGMLDLVHPDDRATLDGVLHGLLPGIPATLNARIRCSDGSHRWMSVLLRAVRDSAGTVIGYAGGWRDIDEQVAALRTAEDARDRHLLLQSMTSDVVLLEVDGLLVWVSSSVERLLGWMPEELEGRSTELLWEPKDDHVLTTLRADALAGEPTPAVCRLRDVAGTEIWAQVVARPWITRDDEDGIAFTLTDYRPVHHAIGALVASESRQGPVEG